jgi:hypothetical protein
VLLQGEESSPQRGASYSNPSVEEFSLLAHAALAESMGAAAKLYIGQAAYFEVSKVKGPRLFSSAKKMCHLADTRATVGVLKCPCMALSPPLWVGGEYLVRDRGP